MRLRGNIPREMLFSKYYPEADIFVLPTLAEPFGFSILEAMSCSLPIVSTNIYAIPEMVKNNKNGFLINVFPNEFGNIAAKNYKNFHLNYKEYLVKELVKKLSLLIENHNLRKKFGKKSLEIVKKKFSFKIRNKKILKIYNNILKE